MSEVLDQRFPWTRFWSPRGSRIQLLDGGYLTDPETDFGRRVNPDLVRLSEVSKIRCLVLLGEPGLGKTSTLELEKAAIESDVQSSGDLIQWIRLEEFGSEDRLYRRLFDGTTFQAWLGGKAQLHLFLDSLDESRLLIRNVASFLAGELCRSEYSVERLWFRIACRTAEWPDLLEKALQKRWSENVGVYELAPLRRKDVAAAAEQSGFSASEFVDAVDRAEAVGFAIRPVTLRLLLKLFWSYPVSVDGVGLGN